MNELQQVQLDILREVIAVCRKLEIDYFLVCGSALGAVKYGGFIPWDDDLDIGMFRSDYEIFLKNAQSLFPEHLFLQTFQTDPNYPQFYAKVRDSRTTYIEKSVSHISMHHGIYIDVFPLDGLPQEPGQRKHLLRSLKFFQLKQTCAYRGSKSLKLRCLMGLFTIFGVRRRLHKSLNRIDELLKKTSDPDSPIICNHGNWQGSLEYAPREQYGDGVMMKFEGIDARIPEKFDEYLTQKYGDWRLDPSKEKQTGHHYYSVMDLDKSYTEFMI